MEYSTALTKKRNLSVALVGLRSARVQYFFLVGCFSLVSVVLAGSDLHGPTCPLEIYFTIYCFGYVELKRS